MKHKIARSLVLLIAAGLLVYVGWLFFQGYAVVAADSEAMNIIVLSLCGLVALYLLGGMFVPSLLPMNRWGLALLGILIIFAAEIYLVDKPQQMIYLADIMKLVGVFLVIAGPMKLFISPATAEKLASKDVEIIEV